MKILKGIGIAVLVILAIALAGIYFLPNSYTVTRSIEIDRSPDEVMARVTDYNNWNDWSPWYEQEPNAKWVFEGAPGTNGHKMAWVGEKLGEGSLTIASASVAEGVNAKLAFVKPFKSEAEDIWQFEATTNGTKVSWISKGELTYPIGRLFGLSIESMLGPQKERGLAKLKTVMELPKAAEIEALVKETTGESDTAKALSN